ncbi:AMP nucleosidase [Candidatus Kinetoplastidibacterium galati]|uniref:AMP nucleosidase n=1 Tax=Candidatus Kinetoplastidibacterium galati TCC219 TaxID=1208921 RepID=M1LTW0_9PROT|nr:AMP nucleosidase [Candidatus Kinetoplastibacterium galatii]AGF48987.1 AMP nucleosidase [Candidatus Kinetoplastibacterium galatii TCC219]
MDSIFMENMQKQDFKIPERFPFDTFQDAELAVDRLIEIYERNTKFLRDEFSNILINQQGNNIDYRVRSCYPAIRIQVSTHDSIDSRFSYGHVAEPGIYQTTVTRPKLFRSYLVDQVNQLLHNHRVPVSVGESNSPIPLHFAFSEGAHVKYSDTKSINRPLRDIFDVPDLSVTDDAIVNGTWREKEGDNIKPLAPFTAARIDYSLQRLQHYTATAPHFFQNYVLFTNYQFYVDEFCEMAKKLVMDGTGGYTSLVEPGNIITSNDGSDQNQNLSIRTPQMPAYHLTRPNHSGITLVNIGVGPSNAKTITDHVAVLRPHVWLMLGHCAGLRDSQRLGDYVLAHGYVRDDHVLDEDLPLWVPVPALAEVQVALEKAVAEISGLQGWDLKRIMRTGTVVTIDNRNWELHDQLEVVKRFAQSRAIALDMESATIAANGFRLRVPYGTLLCVSDKPLHGELKLPGMASDFYLKQVSQHLEIGVRTLEYLRDMPSEKLHSRKLRTFMETAFQ